MNLDSHQRPDMARHVANRRAHLLDDPEIMHLLLIGTVQ